MNAELATPARQGRSFRAVFVVFVALLAVGLALGFVVYKKYVAYEPRVAGHAPADASVALRVDLTHVMFYEPFRRSIFPLADRFGGTAAPRHQRLEARGLRINADVRELLGVLGPGPADWAIVIGGRLPKGSIGVGLAAALRDEGRLVREEGAGTYVLPDFGLAFAETPDGALALASSRDRLQGVVSPGAPDPVLAAGAGGVIVRASALPAPLHLLTASFRAGSVVEVRGQAEVDAAFQAPEAALRSFCEQLAGVHPASASAVKGLTTSRNDSKIDFQVGLPREAVLGIVELLSQRIPG